MIRKVLIANRGEIAVRIIRACREMGIETVAVYSEADREALHTQLADEAICIGPAPSSESYLNMEQIISATIVSGADAIHPGFGFLSENDRFAALCEQCHIIFIGPNADVIRKLGNKSNARNTMIAAGVPVIPGSKEPLYHAEEALAIAEEVGYPVIVKAALGGGGKGMRVAYHQDELENAFMTAQKESMAAFGDNTMYLEHFVEHPKHIEFQILADSYGHVIHLGERDCSIQRNHQKLIEESPCAIMSDALRQKMGEAAVNAAKAAGYVNAGTIEFLLEKTGRFYFMEMNTRIQVEHPVTEWVTGIDLIKEQIRIADGRELSYTQEDVKLTGHAIECRINAENPYKGFRPCPGKITDMYLPGGKGIRIDSAIYSGYEVPPYYDNMLAKLIVFAKNRNEAITKMRSALGEVIIEGIDTNVDYQYEILNDPDYQNGDFDIEFLKSVLQNSRNNRADPRNVNCEDNVAENEFNILQNAAGELCLLIRSRNGRPRKPCFICDNSNFTILFRNNSSAVFLEDINPVAVEALNKVNQMLVVELNNDEVVREYVVPIVLIEGLTSYLQDDAIYDKDSGIQGTLDRVLSHKQQTLLRKLYCNWREN